MLLVAAKDAIVAPTAFDAETIAEGFENSYDLQDLQDVSDRPEDEGTVIVDSMTAAEDPLNMAKDGEDAIAVMAVCSWKSWLAQSKSISRLCLVYSVKMMRPYQKANQISATY